MSQVCLQLQNTGGGAGGEEQRLWPKGSPTGHCAIASDVTEGLVEDNF